jgi:hypothetical protein
MYLPYLMQSTKYAQHLEEIETRCEQRRAIREAGQPRHSIATALGERLHAALLRRTRPVIEGREAGRPVPDVRVR